MRMLTKHERESIMKKTFSFKHKIYIFGIAFLYTCFALITACMTEYHSINEFLYNYIEYYGSYIYVLPAIMVCIVFYDNIDVQISVLKNTILKLLSMVIIVAVTYFEFKISDASLLVVLIKLMAAIVISLIISFAVYKILNINITKRDIYIYIRVSDMDIIYN